MTIRFDLSQQDAYSYLIRTWGSCEKETMISSIISLAIIVLMISNIMKDDSDRLILYVLIIMIVIGTVQAFYSLKSRMKKILKRNPHIVPLGKYEINVTESGMEIARDGENRTVAWDEIWHSDERKKYFILYVSEKASVIIPKYRIPTHEVKELRSLLLKYIPEYRG